MAIFKSTLLSEIRGSLNGATFSRTKAGAIMRNRTKPVQPNTQYQVDQRINMQFAADVFKQMDLNEIQGWQDAIAGVGFRAVNALGDSYTPSAKQVVTMTALNLRSVGVLDLPKLDAFIADPNLPAVGAGLAFLTANDVAPFNLEDFQLEAVNMNTTGFVQIKATRALLPTIRNYTKYLRFIGSFATVGNVPANINLVAAYNARFGTPSFEGQDGHIVGLAIRAVNSDSGLAGAWQEIGPVRVDAA